MGQVTFSIMLSLAIMGPKKADLRFEAGAAYAGPQPVSRAKADFTWTKPLRPRAPAAAEVRFTADLEPLPPVR